MPRYHDFGNPFARIDSQDSEFEWKSLGLAFGECDIRVDSRDESRNDLLTSRMIVIQFAYHFALKL